MATLRENVVNTINELDPLINADITPEEKNAVRSRLKVLYVQLEGIIAKTIPNTTSGFDEAIAALENATKAASDARKDISKIIAAIDKTTDAVNKIEKVIKIGIKLVA